eukprot:tig00000552_g2072.t1
MQTEERSLDDPVSALPGVGPVKAQRLRSWGLGTVRRLLEWVPRDRVHAGDRASVAALAGMGGSRATIVGRVTRVRAAPARSRPRLVVLTLAISDDSGASVEVVKFYNGTPASSLLAAFQLGTLVSASGTVEVAGPADAQQGGYRKRPGSVSLKSAEVNILRPAWEAGPDAADPEPPRVTPLYRLPSAPGEAGSGRRGAAADLRLLGAAIQAALPYAELFEDPLPPDILEKLGLPPLSEAMRNVHGAAGPDEMEAASRRLVFDELLALQLALLLRKAKRRSRRCSVPPSPPGELIRRFRESLPFELTGAQRRVLDDITRDLAGEAPMSRLVMGDVGSGKTVVAVAALLGAVEAGAQGALMAPTEVLAAQHFRNVEQWCRPLGVSVALLTGSVTGRARARVLEGIRTGATAVVVGTHALLEPSVQFRQLGLCVIDEQHRYGVEQRSRLTSAAAGGQAAPSPFAPEERGGAGETGDEKEGAGIDAEAAGDLMAGAEGPEGAPAPHVLSMSATPIPRTLALALHGDLDISVLDEMPSGRKPIRTRLLRPEEREDAYGVIREHCARGHQAYVLFPLVEESEAMAHLERDAALAEFVEGRTDVLVCTTIVEVGVDVANATVMVIEGAERFGLAQLHQLRGRIGRGEAESECLLIAGAPTPEALGRLAALVECSDGFRVAEEDLAIRGAGQLLGTRQSGVPGLSLSDLSNPDHALLLVRAREARPARPRAPRPGTDALKTS